MYSEFIEMLDGYSRGLIRKANEAIYLAWHIAMLERQNPIPDLKDILIDENEPIERHEQTDDEKMAMCRMLNAAYGGTEVAVSV